jgi:hypothetical protein
MPVKELLFETNLNYDFEQDDSLTGLQHVSLHQDYSE